MPGSAEIPTLATERLLLRAPGAEDFEAYKDFYADAEASAFYGGPLTAAQAWRRLAADIGHWALRGFGLWSVTEAATGRTVGGCGILWPEGVAAPRAHLVDGARRAPPRLCRGGVARRHRLGLRHVGLGPGRDPHERREPRDAASGRQAEPRRGRAGALSRRYRTERLRAGGVTRV